MRPAPPRKPLLIVSERDEAILRAIAKVRYATAKDIAYLLPIFSPSSLSHVREVMTALAGGGDYQPYQYLLRFRRPQITIGTTEKVFTLGARGREYFAEVLGEQVSWWSRPYYVKGLSYAFLMHALLLTRVIAALTCFVRRTATYTLTDCRLSYALTGTQGAPTEEEAEEAQATALPVIPDAWVVLHRYDGQDILLWLEIDCGTETAKKYTASLASRIAFLQEDYERLFGTTSVLVCYLACYPDTRRQALQGWTQALLRELKLEDLADIFRFATVNYDSLYSAPLFDAPVWYRPDSHIPLPLLTGRRPNTQGDSHGTVHTAS